VADKRTYELSTATLDDTLVMVVDKIGLTEAACATLAALKKYLAGPARVSTSSTTLGAGDTAGIVGTAAITVTCASAATLTDGFIAPVYADGATVTFVMGSSNIVIPSGQYLTVEVANGKRWISGPVTPTVPPG